MSEKFKILKDRIVKVWLKDKFFRQGKLIDVNDKGIVIDDRRDGISFLNFEYIESISEVKNGY
jgi:hypothetical protein